MYVTAMLPDVQNDADASAARFIGQPMKKLNSLMMSVAMFAAVFFALQYAWGLASGTAVERWVVDDATVHAAVALINWLTPEVAAVAHGASIQSAGASINIRNGCEGTEILFLLAAALLAHRFSWRTRLVGLAVSVVYVFCLNQLRLLALYYALRGNPSWFPSLHGVVAPLALVGCCVLFFRGLQQWEQRRPEARP